RKRNDFDSCAPVRDAIRRLGATLICGAVDQTATRGIQRAGNAEHHFIYTTYLLPVSAHDISLVGDKFAVSKDRRVALTALFLGLFDVEIQSEV
ncbi:MAG: hypothetical protein VCB06_07345, partial [Alphaproteobacteria bacterium]